MGPLFLLIIFGVLYVILSIIFGAGLAGIFWGIFKLRGVENGKGVINEGFFFPFKLIPYIAVSVVAGVIICEYVRGVDAPFTDYWSIPVGSNIQLMTIDIPDKWHLSPNGGGEALSGDIVSIGMNDKVAYGVTSYESNFIYNIGSSTYKVINSKSEFEAELKKYGVKKPILVSPAQYYRANRIVGDIIMLLLLLIYPVVSFYKLTRKLKNTT